nr:TMV resistance protein N-like [Ipomoea batatas]
MEYMVAENQERKQTPRIFAVEGKPAVRFFKDEWGRLAENEERGTLVGKFSKGRPPLDLIREKFQSTCSLTGSAHVGSLDLRHILIRFSREDDCEKVLAKGLAMVAGKPMRLTRWSPDWRTRKESPFAAVWVELPELPSMRRKGHRADSISPNSNSNTSISPTLTLDSTENLQTQSPFLATQSNSTPIDLIKRNQNTLPIVPLEETSWASIDHKSPNFSSTIDSSATPSSLPPFSNIVPFSNRARSSAKRALLFRTPRQY